MTRPQGQVSYFPGEVRRAARAIPVDAREAKCREMMGAALARFHESGRQIYPALWLHAVVDVFSDPSMLGIVRVLAIKRELEQSAGLRQADLTPWAATSSEFRGPSSEVAS